VTWRGNDSLAIGLHWYEERDDLRGLDEDLPKEVSLRLNGRYEYEQAEAVCARLPSMVIFYHLGRFLSSP
jgi:hypothetical protein